MELCQKSLRRKSKWKNLFCLIQAIWRSTEKHAAYYLPRTPMPLKCKTIKKEVLSIESPEVVYEPP